MNELIQAVRLVRGAHAARTDREHAECVQKLDRLRRSSSRADLAVCFAELAFENASVIVILVCMAGFGLLYQAVKYLSTVVSGS